jgi:antitoxin component of RelBE/YafQ-DinJ toxin-antitoxin module
VRFLARDLGLLRRVKSKPPLQVVLTRGDTDVYIGKCLVKREMPSGDNIDLVLTLIPSVEDKAGCGLEEALEPALVATCRHPLSDKIIRVSVVAASYNSLVVREHPEHVSLFRGLVVPGMRIDFGTGDSAQCTAKVVGGEGDAWLMSILDMPIFDQRKLFSFIEKERGMSSAVSAAIDPEDILKFFFEAGFIYPEKYAGVAKSRDRLKEMLSRLYIDAPSICQHFVQDDKGVIEAHISMVRFYERSWIIHHHAALGNGAGSAVLAQIFRYINSYSSFASTRMDYLMCYYRRENHFPNRVLGGFARFLGKPSLCSVDPFAYLYHSFDPGYKEKRGSAEWRLEPTGRKDLLELEGFYARASGGLMLKAFGLDAIRRGKAGDVESEFKKAGLRRQKRLFSLKRDGKLKAVMLALDSDAGLNMSNLMKSIHVMVINAEDLPFDLLTGQLNRLSSLYEEQKIPILLFPPSYVSDQRVLPEKIYDLLVVRASLCKEFAEFTERLTNRTMRRRYGVLTSDQERGNQ